MSDTELRELERAWRASPDDEAAIERLIAAQRRRGEEPSLELIGSQARWKRLVSFVRKWFDQPLGKGSGLPPSDLRAVETRLGRALPVALKEWYRLVGRRRDVTGEGQDYAVAVDQLGIRASVLTVYAENQSVVTWVLREKDLGEEDPPLYLLRDGDMIQENPRLSEFLLSMVLRQSIYTQPRGFGGWMMADEEAVSAFEKAYTPLPFPPGHWPIFPSQLHGDADTIVITWPETWEIWMTARNESASERAYQLGLQFGAWESYFPERGS